MRIRRPRRPWRVLERFNPIGWSVSDENERSRSARRRECQRFDRRRARARRPIAASPTSSTVPGSGTLANRTLSMANGAACPMEGGLKGFSPTPKIAPSSRSRPKKALPEKVKNGEPESGLEVRIEMKKGLSDRARTSNPIARYWSIERERGGPLAYRYHVEEAGAVEEALELEYSLVDVGPTDADLDSQLAAGDRFVERHHAVATDCGYERGPVVEHDWRAERGVAQRPTTTGSVTCKSR